MNYTVKEYSEISLNRMGCNDDFIKWYGFENTLICNLCFLLSPYKMLNGCTSFDWNLHESSYGCGYWNWPWIVINLYCKYKHIVNGIPSHWVWLTLNTTIRNDYNESNSWSWRWILMKSTAGMSQYESCKPP